MPELHDDLEDRLAAIGRVAADRAELAPTQFVRRRGRQLRLRRTSGRAGLTLAAVGGLVGGVVAVRGPLAPLVERATAPAVSTPAVSTPAPAETPSPSQPGALAPDELPPPPKVPFADHPRRGAAFDRLRVGDTVDPDWLRRQVVEFDADGADHDGPIEVVAEAAGDPRRALLLAYRNRAGAPCRTLIGERGGVTRELAAGTTEYSSGPDDISWGCGAEPGPMTVEWIRTEGGLHLVAGVVPAATDRVRIEFVGGQRPVELPVRRVDRFGVAYFVAHVRGAGTVVKGVALAADGRALATDANVDGLGGSES